MKLKIKRFQGGITEKIILLLIYYNLISGHLAFAFEAVALIMI